MPGKLRLELDALRVESFPAASDAALDRGTVHGREGRSLATCWPEYTCPECATPPDPTG